MQCMMPDENNRSCGYMVWTCKACGARGCQNRKCRNQNFDQSRCLSCGKTSAT